MVDYEELANLVESYGTLRNAPLKEAVIAFYFVEQVVETNDVKEKLDEVAPDIEWERIVNHRFDFPDPNVLATGQPFSPNTITRRYDGRKADSNLALILEGNVFAVAQPAPYTSWQEFSTAALDIWSNVSTALGLSLKHYGVRYINQFTYELSLSNYLTENFLPKAGPLQLEHLNYQRLNEQRISGTQYNVSTFLEFSATQRSPEVRGTMNMDISISTIPSDEQDLADPQRLEELRLLKNYFFFNTINKTVIDLCR